MKRSKLVKLIVMGSAAVAAVGCDQPQTNPEEVNKPTLASTDTTTYSSIEDCVAKGLYTEKFCREQFDSARKLHLANAPRFSNLQDCVEQFGAGACQVQSTSAQPNTVAPSSSTSDTGSFWMPAMAGYMLGQALGNREVDYNYYNAPQPVYKNSLSYDRYTGPSYARGREKEREGGGYSYGYSGGNNATRSNQYAANVGSKSQSETRNQSLTSSSSSYGTNSYKPPQARTQVVARSGFGSKAGGFSSGG